MRRGRKGGYSFVGCSRGHDEHDMRLIGMVLVVSKVGRVMTDLYH